MSLFRHDTSAAVAEPAVGAFDEPGALRAEVDALRKSQAVIEFEPDGTILWANDNFLSALGYELDEIRGRHHRMFVLPEEVASPEYGRFWRQLGDGEFSAGEYARVTKSGETIWIKASYNPVFGPDGSVARVVKYAADITETIRQRNDAQRTMSMVDKMPIAVMYVGLDRVVQYANEATVAMFRKLQDALPIRADQLVGTCIDRLHTEPSHLKTLLADPKNFPLTNQIELAGEVIKFDAHAIYDDRGHYVGAMASGQIVTDTVKAKRKAAEVGATLSSSVTEMGATIEEISRSVQQTANLAQDSESIAKETSEFVVKLGESSRQIGEVVGVIQELADQTNLLALNATIEAARAGESGRSFAVVASEVKELANATAKATHNIEVSVNQIQDSINRVVDSTGRITASIGEVSTNTTTVAAAIEEQSATMASLGETATELQSLTNE